MFLAIMIFHLPELYTLSSKLKMSPDQHESKSDIHHWCSSGLSSLCFHLKFCFYFYNCLPATAVQTLCSHEPGEAAWQLCLTVWGWWRKRGRWTERRISNSWTSFLMQATCLIPWAQCIFILAGIVAVSRTAADSIPRKPKESFPSDWQQQFQPWQTCFQL